MELHEALAQITEIRRQIARTETFRGYRSATVASTAGVALLAGIGQAICLPQAAADPLRYVALWGGGAALCLAVTGVELALRCRRSVSTHASRITWLAVEQFLPAVLVGGVLTGAVVRSAPENLWMLPGLWSLLFSLGVFASCRLLPRATFWVGIWYLLAGGVCLGCLSPETSMSPWTMAVVFGTGQLLGAAILYFTLERSDA